MSLENRQSGRGLTGQSATCCTSSGYEKPSDRWQLGRAILLGFCWLLTAPAAALADVDTALEYSWQEGFQYRCFFRVTATVSESKEEITGLTTYTPVTVDPAAPAVAEPQGTCTGTAFAVTPDGYLVTCAHVVHGATTITAHFGPKTCQANVVSYDPDRDLAVLKVEARNLPSVGFCDSEKVQLAQEIRVVGYPLSDMLGESVKMSRGTISGIIRREDENRFQIDARVNPGNSGGPLVDEQGRVVGVASELLTSDAIDSVGFAIPANEAVNLLRAENIDPELPADGAKLEGPDLAKRVTPAVALLKVETGPGGVATKKKQVLRFLGSCHGTGRYGSSPSHDSGKLIVDSCGEIHSHEGELVVPLLFQPLGTVGIEQLPGDSRKSWKSFRFLVLSVSSEPESRFPGPLSPYYRPPYRPRYRSPYDRFRPRGFPFDRGEVRTKIMPAVEEVEYRRLSESADGAVTISKNYRFYTVEEDDGGRMLDMKTTGTVTWDESLGCVRQSHMKGQVSLNRSNVSIRIPVEVTYEVKKEKPKPREQASTHPKTGTAADSASRPPVRKIEPSAAGTTKPSAIQQAPSTTGLSKFNPDD